MFSFIKKAFARTKTLKNDYEELRLIQEAFSQLDSKKKYFKDMHRMYEARYASEELHLLNSNNYNHIYVPMIRNIINTIVGHFNTAFFSGKNPIEVRSYFN